MSASGQLGPRRFVAATATEALSMVKQAIGPDAILLSNREVDDGIEIIAMAQDQFKEIAPRATARSQTPAAQAIFAQRPRSDAGGFQEGIPVSSAADRAPRPEGLRQMSDSAIRTANHKLVIADVATSPMRNADGSPVFAPEVAAAHFHSETGASRPRHLPMDRHRRKLKRADKPQGRLPLGPLACSRLVDRFPALRRPKHRLH